MSRACSPFKKFRNEYKVLVGGPGGKRPSGRRRRRWEDNTKMDFKEAGCEARNWIDFAYVRAKQISYNRNK